jgi:xanthine dehydrogenase YagS FAD-binding subunit
MLSNFEYKKAQSLPQGVRELQDGHAKVLAGGTEILGAMRDGVTHAQKLVSISTIKGLNGISATSDGGLRIGALTALTEIATPAAITPRYRALAQGAASAASPQLRNQGTLGGNLCQRPRCWYLRSGFHCLRAGGDECFAVDGENEYHAIFGGDRCFIVHPSDTAPALMALDARLRIVSPEGSRLLPISDFFLLPDESLTRENRLSPADVIAESLLPTPKRNLRSSYRKVRARGSWDFALAGVALAIEMQENVVTSARVILSGVAPIPWRCKTVEQMLLHRRLSPAVAKEAAVAATLGASPLSMNDYKVDLVKGIVEEELLSLLSA